MTDIVDKLVDLHKQATTERSHYYVASVVKEAVQEIITLRLKAGALTGRHWGPAMADPDKNDDEIEVTWEMIEAGCDQVTDLTRNEARRIYVAMEMARRAYAFKADEEPLATNSPSSCVDRSETE